MLLLATSSASCSRSLLANTLVPSFSASVDKVSPGFEFAAFLLAIPLWILLLRLEGLYDRDEERTDHSTVDDIVGVFRSVTIGVWVFALFSVATNTVQPGLARLGLFWAIAVALIPTLRAGARVLCRHLPGYTQNAVIVGAGRVGQQLALKIANHREYGIHLVGFVDDRPVELDDELAQRFPLLLGGPHRLREFIKEHGVERVIIAFSNDSHERCSRTFARSATSTCRSTSCLATSRSSAPAPTCTRSRGSPWSGSGRQGFRARRASSSARSTSARRCSA